MPQDIAVVGRCAVLFPFFGNVFFCMLRMAQHVDLTLTNRLPFLSPSLPICPNLLLANNFVGILNASGFSLLVPTTLFPSCPHLFFYYISVKENIMWRYIILPNIVLLFSFVSEEPKALEEHGVFVLSCQQSMYSDF